ncbi:MAG: FAD-dependent oxidoreductase [Pseudomonadota bacterium]|nr:FAD-dependent oxidoreductase [Pseudomonadota bacterium]
MLLQPESRGLWAATAPMPPATLPLLETVEIDIAIVGAGFTGMSTALHLAESAVEVAIVEATRSALAVPAEMPVWSIPGSGYSCRKWPGRSDKWPRKE